MGQTAQTPSSTSITGQTIPSPSATLSPKKKKNSSNGTLKNTCTSHSPKTSRPRPPEPASPPTAKNFSNTSLPTPKSLVSTIELSSPDQTPCNLKSLARPHFTPSTGKHSKTL